MPRRVLHPEDPLFAVEDPSLDIRDSLYPLPLCTPFVPQEVFANLPLCFANAAFRSISTSSSCGLVFHHGFRHPSERLDWLQWTSAIYVGYDLLCEVSHSSTPR